MNEWRSECGVMRLVIPARRQIRRTSRAALLRSMRRPLLESSTGPWVLPSSAASRARDTRGGRGMRAGLWPLPMMVMVRWPRCSAKSSASIWSASLIRNPSSPRVHASAWGVGPSASAQIDERAQLAPVEAQRRRLGVDPGTADVLGRVGVDVAVDLGEPVEPRRGGEASADGGAGEMLGFFHLAGPHLDLGPVHLQDPEVVLGAPPEPLQQVRLVVASRGAAVAGQVRGGGQLGTVETLVEAAGMDKVSGEVHGSSPSRSPGAATHSTPPTPRPYPGPCIERLAEANYIGTSNSPRWRPLRERYAPSQAGRSGGYCEGWPGCAFGGTPHRYVALSPTGPSG